MAFDIEIPTPRGRIGINLIYSESAIRDTVLLGYLQLPDGSWQQKGMYSISGATNVNSATPAAALAKILEDEGVYPAPVSLAQVSSWLSSQSQEAAKLVIIKWILRVAREMFLIFLNKIIGVTQGQIPQAPDNSSAPFASAEHALRVAFKSLPYKVDPVTSEITL